MIQALLIILSTVPIVTMLVLLYHIKRNGMDFTGKVPVTPYLYYTAKAALFLLLFIMLPGTCIYPDVLLYLPFRLQDKIPIVQQFMSIPFLLGGNLLFISACISLGIFTRMGIPDKSHMLQTSGVYRISRNPMYAGFLFYYIACFILLPSLITGILISYSAIVHHFIIKNEEKYLTETFGDAYSQYKKHVARYL